MTSQTEISKLNIIEKITFYRHWLWADFFKNEYGKHLKQRQKKNEFGNLYGPQGACMFTWYGIVYSLIEFMDEKKIVIPEIKADIKKVRKKLHLSRNGVFHVQSELGFEKLFKMIGPGGSSIIFKIHDSIGNHIEKTLVRTMLAITSEDKEILREVMGNQIDVLEKKNEALKDTRGSIKNQGVLKGKFLELLKFFR